MSQTEGREQFQESKSSYLIFEETGNIPGHFYIAYSGGLRHFTVNPIEIAGIDNGAMSRYPVLSHLLTSTV